MMKKFTRLFSVLAIIIMSFASTKVEASHLKGSDIYFQCIGGGYYRVVSAWYFACNSGSIAPTSPFSYTVNIDCGGSVHTVNATVRYTSAQQDVPFYCTGVLTTCDYGGSPYNSAPAGTPTGTLVVVYTSDSFYIGPGCTATTSSSQGSRNSSISNLTNPSSQNLYTSASVTIPVDSSCNYSSLFAAFPVNVFCVNQNANFSQGAISLNGDSLVYVLANPRNAANTPINFTAGCDSSFPLGHPGQLGSFCSAWSFDSLTGNINFTPTALGDYVISVRVYAYHNGVLVGSTNRDIQFSVVACNQPAPPVLSTLFSNANVTGGLVLDSTHVGVCPGQQISITLMSVDTAQGVRIIDSSNVLTSLRGSTVTYTYPNGHTDTLIMHILWTPQGADSGFHSFIVTSSDTICPRPGRTTYGFVVSVLRGVSAGPNLVYCNGGSPVTIHATGATHYTWTDSATGGPPVGVTGYSADSSSITVAPGSTHGYIVRGNLIGGCRDRDTVTVKNAPLFSLSSFPKDSVVCKYVRDTVTTAPNPTSVGPFTYHWSTAGAGDTFATVGTGVVLHNTWYYVTVTSVGGCAIKDSTYVRINGSAPRIYTSASNNNVCPGDTVYLSTYAIAENLVSCGLVDTCTDNSMLVSAICNDDTSSTTGINFTNVAGSPFRGNYPSYRIQYLFRASELNATGLTSGSITDIAFFVKTVNSVVPYDSFTVSMGCTSSDSLTGFEGGLYEVAPSQQYTPTQGWSPIPFSRFYGWDGASNLVIQICYSIDPNQSSSDDYVSYTTTSFQGSAYYELAFSGNGCALNSAFGNMISTRPNVRFGMCSPDVVRYHWTPYPSAGGLDTATTIPIVVTRDTTFHVFVSDFGCSNSDTIRVRINPNIGFAATPHNAVLCNGGTVQLNATLTNPPVDTCIREYSVISIPYAPLSGTQNVIDNNTFVSSGNFPNMDDGVSGAFALPFSFPYYCNTYDSIWVSTNAWVSFTNPFPRISSPFTAQALPYTSASATFSPFNSIDFFWSDMRVNATSTIGYFTTGSGASQTFVIKYNNLESYTGGYLTNGEIQLHIDGTVDILLESSNYGTNPHTTGLADTAGIGIAAPGRNAQSYTISTPEAWRFIPHIGPNVIVNTSVWTPNLYLNDSSINNPISSTPVNQTYYVTSNLTINRYTHPTTCVVRDSVRILAVSFHDTLTASVNPVCPGDTTQLSFTTANSVSSIVWTPATSSAVIINTATPTAPKASVTDTTLVRVTATDVNGCTISDSIRLYVPLVQHPSLGPDQIICYDASTPLAIVAGTYTNYQWYYCDAAGNNRTPVPGSTGLTTINGTPRHYYVAYVHGGATSCPYPTSVVLVDSFPRQHISVLPAGPTTFCAGDNVILNSTPGLTNYSWKPLNQTTASITASTPNNYSYSARDAHNCLLYSDTIPVIVNPIPTVGVTNSKNPICTGETDTITATSTPAGGTYSWGTSTGNTLTVTGAGTYNVTVTVNGCTATTSTNVSVAQSPTVSLGADQTICDCHPNVLLTATVTPPAVSAYRWSTGATSATITDTLLGAQSYSLSVTDANGCTASANVNITSYCPKVKIEIFPNDTVSKTDSSVALTAVIGGTGSVVTYLWSANPDSLIMNQGNVSTHLNLGRTGNDTVHVRVTDSHGCIDSNLIVFFVTESDSFVLPNAFTPNGDNNNDLFYPVVGGASASTAKVKVFRVYNRWGQTVHDNPMAGWDGSYGSTSQPNDTYTYFLTVEYPDPKDVSKKLTKSITGSFQLLR